MAPQEDQCHILWHCSHPDMVLLRQEHWAAINHRILKQQHLTYTSSVVKASLLLHDILSKPANHSMLFGRVHASQQPLLNRLPYLTAVGIKQLTDVWKEYAAMVVDLYSQRQQSIQQSGSQMPKVFKSMVGSRVLAAREVLIGIDSNTVLYTDGSKVKTTNYDPIVVSQAHQRTQLTEANCQLLRTTKPPTITKKRKASDATAVLLTHLRHHCNCPDRKVKFKL